MKILAIEFSTAQRGVAVVEAGQMLGAALETATRETHAFALVGRALEEAKLEREAIECLAIGIGPGSYAGIRSAIALAQGWQLAAGTDFKLLGISSAEAIAAGAQAQGWFGDISVVIDAQRGEIYLGEYQVSPVECRATRPLRLATLEEARASCATGGTVIGPEVSRWFEAGKVLFPTADILGRLAHGRVDFVNGAQLEPIYLRETAFVKAPPPRIIPGG